MIFFMFFFLMILMIFSDFHLFFCEKLEKPMVFHNIFQWFAKEFL